MLPSSKPSEPSNVSSVTPAPNSKRKLFIKLPLRLVRATLIVVGIFGFILAIGFGKMFGKMAYHGIKEAAQEAPIAHSSTDRRRGMMPDVDAARQAGFTDRQIAENLAKKDNFNIEAARKAGYSDAEIIDFFVAASKKSAMPPR